MFLFLRLILAHFLADFPLQPNLIYKVKLRSFWGQALHAAIFTICSIVLCWPFLRIKALWILIVFLGTIHLLIDCLKIRYFNTEKYRVGTFLADQALHIATISVIFLNGLLRGTMRPFVSPNLRLYRTDRNSKTVEDQLNADIAEANKHSLSGSPTFVMNGVVVTGTRSQSYFNNIMKRLLEQ